MASAFSFVGHYAGRAAASTSPTATTALLLGTTGGSRGCVYHSNGLFRRCWVTGRRRRCTGPLLSPRLREFSTRAHRAAGPVGHWLASSPLGWATSPAWTRPAPTRCGLGVWVGAKVPWGATTTPTCHNGRSEPDLVPAGRSLV